MDTTTFHSYTAHGISVQFREVYADFDSISVAYMALSAPLMVLMYEPLGHTPLTPQHLSDCYSLFISLF